MVVGLNGYPEISAARLRPEMFGRVLFVPVPRDAGRYKKFFGACFPERDAPQRRCSSAPR